MIYRLSDQHHSRKLKGFAGVILLEMRCQGLSSGGTSKNSIAEIALLPLLADLSMVESNVDDWDSFATRVFDIWIILSHMGED